MMNRLRQVGYYVTTRWTKADAAWAVAVLKPAQQALFLAMGPPDRCHAVRVARRLAAQGAPTFALEAALLHDCAKPSDYNLVMRSFAVLAAPWLGELPAEPRLTGWKRFVQIYRWHDHYGLELARRAGTSSDALHLLKCYATPPSGEAPAWLGPLKDCDDLG